MTRSRLPGDGYSCCDADHFTPCTAFSSEHSAFPDDNHIHPRPLLGFIQPVQKGNQELNQEGSHVNQPEPLDWPTIEAIEIINE